MFGKLLLLLSPILAALSDARCTDPSVRREWRMFSTSEKADWIAAVNCLAKRPHNDSLTPFVDPSISLIPPVNASGSFYDDFVYIHMDLNTRIHFTGLFFPWHRWYVAVYEQKLKSECGYKGVSPYWNWTQDAANFYGSNLFKESAPKSGLGGWGNPSRDFEVPDGGFSNFKLSYPSFHTLRRNFTLQPYLASASSPFFANDSATFANVTFTQSEVDKMINGFVGDFKGFQTYMEKWVGAHGSVHLIMGGDMGGTCPHNAPANCTPGPTWSANEPLFWMHHAMVDKIWYDWQHKNSANFWAYHGGSVEEIDNLSDYDKYPNGGPPYLSFNSTLPADGLFEEVTIGDVMDTTGGFLCYVYDT